MDASALLAFLRREQGWERVLHLFRTEECYAHAANLCEVYYGFGRRMGEPAGRRALEDLRALGLLTRSDGHLPFWEEVGTYKLRLPDLSLADSICLVVARSLGAEIIATDTDFREAARQRLCRVRFIR